MKILVPTLLAAVAGVLTAGAASLTPIAVGEPAVTDAIAGRPNLALASGGASAFSSSDLQPPWIAADVNDGIFNDSGNSWIPLTTGTSEFIAVQFPAPVTLSTVVWLGQTGYNGRSGGTYVLQYTTDASPSGASTWTEIGTYVYTEAGCASPMPRSLFAFPAVASATAMRLVLANSACGIQLAVQEFEAYGPTTDPVSITSQPVGGDALEGSDFTFTVAANNAESYQWRKDDADIPGATSSSYTLINVKTNDAGTYTVVAANSVNSVTSDPAILTVTPGPTYATYADAILTDNPIHYYPLDETEGTTANDAGSLATTGGTYSGGITLGQQAASERLGTCAWFDGNPGTLVDLGLFHPGDAITIEAWANLDSDARAEWNAIIARWDGSYELDFAPGNIANLVVYNESGTMGLAAGSAPSQRARWHHLVGVFSGGVATVYVDGIKGSEQNIGGVLRDLGPVPDRVMIGATRSGTEGSFNFKGFIDEVAIYDHALQPAQIRAHYRASFPPEPLALTIEHAVQVSWPTFPPGYVLQAAGHVEGPYTNVTKAPIVENNVNYVTMPAEGARIFFQLLAP